MSQKGTATILALAVRKCCYSIVAVAVVAVVTVVTVAAVVADVAGVSLAFVTAVAGCCC